MDVTYVPLKVIHRHDVFQNKKKLFLCLGIDFPSGQGRIRSYVFLPEEQATERTNQTYDFALESLKKVCYTLSIIHK